MKVCIALDHRKRDISETGKGYFARRLMSAMESKGVAFVSPEENADIDLGIGRWQYAPRAKKKILRLGAAHIDSSSQYKEYNKRKLASLKIADGVVYQSEFSKIVCDKFIGKIPKPFKIITNGAEITCNNTHALAEYDTYFLASTRDWIPQKNLKDIVVSFLEARNKNACLFVTGKTHGLEKKFIDNRIKFLGLVSQSRLTELYSICDIMVNIVYADACPNNVVEALCAGCWVLSSNSGGTKELVREGENGNILPLYDKPYSYGLVDLSKPIKINREPLIGAFKRLYKRHSVNAYLDINSIADKYISFFNEILK